MPKRGESGFTKGVNACEGAYMEGIEESGKEGKIRISSRTKWDTVYYVEEMPM